MELHHKLGTIGQKWPQYKGLRPTPLAIKEIIIIHKLASKM
jgi:hypothetical protein